MKPIIVNEFECLNLDPTEDSPAYKFDAHFNGCIYRCFGDGCGDNEVWVYSPGRSFQPSSPLYVGDKALEFARAVVSLAQAPVVLQKSPGLNLAQNG